MKTFESIRVGDKAELTHTILQEDVEKFVELTGDDNKLHIDEDFAGTTPMKKPVVHGMLGASFISTIIGTKLPGDGALWFSQNLEFLLPVRVGDEITVVAEVIAKNARQKTIELNTEIYNQKGQKVTGGVAKVKIVEVSAPTMGSEKIDATPVDENKVALVIGGTGGIGYATALQLAKDGFKIALHYHSNKKKAEVIQKEITSSGIVCRIYKADVSNELQVSEMVNSVARNFDTITTLVNCATIHISAEPFAGLKWARIQAHLDISLKSTFFLVKAVVPIMEQGKFGSIVNLTTQYTESTPPTDLLAYVTAKSALNGLSKALAVEFAPKGITVNLVSPGMTDTDLIADVPEKSRLMIAAKTPLRRLAFPEDVAGAISYLVSQPARYLTGETIRVNGGQAML